jgi:hypothetical protein
MKREAPLVTLKIPLSFVMRLVGDAPANAFQLDSLPLLPVDMFLGTAVSPPLPVSALWLLNSTGTDNSTSL